MRKTRRIDWWLFIRHCWDRLLLSTVGVQSKRIMFDLSKYTSANEFFMPIKSQFFSCQSHEAFEVKDWRERTRNGLLNCPSIKSVIKKFINFLRHSGPSVTYMATTAHTAFIAALIRRDKSFEMRSSLVIIIHREQGSFLCAVASAFVCWFFRIFLI